MSVPGPCPSCGVRAPRRRKHFEELGGPHGFEIECECGASWGTVFPFFNFGPHRARFKTKDDAAADWRAAMERNK